MANNILKQYHILNGDALKEQFPGNIRGEQIIARECLVDGNVNGNDLPELYRTRAQFISETYEGFTQKDYYETTVTEFEKTQNIEADSDINLWFEDDLFCQVNLWKLYQQNDCNTMLGIADKLKDRFPFLHPAILAHKDRLPQNGSLGRPAQALIKIMKELNTTEFVPVFKVFCEQEAIYGFGDLQVKRMLDEIISKN